MSKPPRFLGVVRGAAASPEDASAVFREVLGPKRANARRLGQLSHRLFVKMPVPGEAATPEILGLDLWCDPAGMREHYQSIHGYERAFASAPQTSVWQQATGGVWSEW